MTELTSTFDTKPRVVTFFNSHGDKSLSHIPLEIVIYQQLSFTLHRSHKIEALQSPTKQHMHLATNRQVGQRWKVAWRDGTVHLAEIVEIRKAEVDSDAAAPAPGPASASANGMAGSAVPTGTAGGGESGGSGSSAAAATGGGGAGGNVYVHYVDFDRRLDEWVGMDRVDLAAGQQKAVALHNGDKRRVTTRMKREC